MAIEGVRGYLQLASGLAEMSRAKATEAASALLALSGGVAGGSLQSQVQELAEELLAAAAANRRSIVALVRSEIESSMASLMPVEELDRARAAVAKLSTEVEELREQVMASPAVRSIPEPGRSAIGAMSGIAASMLTGHGGSRPAGRTGGFTQTTPAAGVSTTGPRASGGVPGGVVDSTPVGSAQPPAGPGGEVLHHAPARRQSPAASPITRRRRPAAKRSARTTATTAPAATNTSPATMTGKSAATTAPSATKTSPAKKAASASASAKKASASAEKASPATASTPTKKTSAKTAAKKTAAVKMSAKKASAKKTSAAKASAKAAAPTATASAARENAGGGS